MTERQTSQPATIESPSTDQRGLTNRSVAWTYATGLIQAAIQLGSMATLARAIQPADFGVISICNVIIALSFALGQFGIFHAMVQRERVNAQQLKSAASIAIAASICISAVTIAVAPQVAGYFQSSVTADCLIVLALSLPIRSYGAAADAVLLRAGNYSFIASAELVSAIAGNGILAPLLALNGAGVWALTFGLLAQYVLRSAIVVFKTRLVPALRIDSAVIDFVRFGAGQTIAQTANVIATEADNFVVGATLGTGALGIYGRAYQLIVAPATLFTGLLDRLLFPAFARLQKREAELARFYSMCTVLGVGVGLCGTIAAWSEAPLLIRVILGSDWLGVVQPFRVFALILPVRIAFQISDSLCRSLGAVYRSGWRQCVYASVVIAGALAGSKSGLAAVAVGVALAMCLKLVLMTVLSTSLLNARVYSHLVIASRAVVVAAPVILADTLLHRVLSSVELNDVSRLGLTALVLGTTTVLSLFPLVRKTMMIGSNIRMDIALQEVTSAI